jgi:hypothetical protein
MQALQNTTSRATCGNLPTQTAPANKIKSFYVAGPPNLFLAEGILRVSFGSSSWARCAVIVHWRELGVSLLSFWVV